MLKHLLIPTDGILILEPSTPLEAADFEAVANEIDPYIAEHGSLAGVLIVSVAFPAWINLESAIKDLQLIENYHQQIKKLAIVSNNGLLDRMPRFTTTSLHPEVKHFPESQYEEALQWLRKVPLPTRPAVGVAYIES